MTKQQADNIYALTSSQYWRSFEAVLNEQLQAYQTELETCKQERLPKIQGSIIQIRSTLAIRRDAEALLEK